MWNCPRTFVFVLAVAALTASAAAAELRVDSPAELPELNESLVVEVSGSAIAIGDVAVRVFRGDVDVSHLASIAQSGLTVEDPDQDGVAESLVAEYTVVLVGVDLRAGDELTFRASASGGALVSRDVTRIVPHVRILATDVFPTGIAAPQPLLVEVEDVVWVAGMTVTARFGGNDVTALLNVLGPTVLADLAGPGSPPSIAYRSSSYTFDPTALGATAGEVLEIRVAIQTPRGTSSSSVVLAALDFERPTPKVASAFASLVKALKLVRGEGGETAVTATAAEIDAAVDAFQEDVKDEQNPGLIDEPRGEGVGPDGAPARFHVKARYSSQGGGDLRFAGSADVMIAIGCDGEGRTGGRGASAWAANTQSGGVAIAVAGDGGTAGGDGGHARATANSTSGRDDDGSAIAIGGDGGDPSPDDVKGGAGGTAESTVEGTESDNDGSPNAGSAGTGNSPGPGTHGRAKWSRRDRGSNGSGPGASEPKSAPNTGG